MEYLFSYGTLQEERTQLALFARRITKIPDQLSGYALNKIWITDPEFLARGEDEDQYTLVATDSNSTVVHGSVLELTSEELLIIDGYEPSNYFRRKVLLASGKEVWVYVAA